MKLGPKTVVMIPARGGSKRVPAKNLRLLSGKPMIAYAIECAKAATERGAALSAIYVNTDSDDIEAAARAFGADVYRRPAHLGSDTAKGDDFAADFIDAIEPDTLVMLNPACPLLSPDDVTAALAAYAESPCDTLITCEQTRMQVFFDGGAVNIDADKPLEPTQNNRPVQTLNFAVTIWNADVFRAMYRESQSGYLGRDRLLHPIPRLHALKVSEPDDFTLAERLIGTRGQGSSEPQYWQPTQNKSS